MSTPHGTPTTYVYGCRCVDCVAANTKRGREDRARRRTQPKDENDARHGKVSFYRNHGCRCERCIAAHAKRCREDRLKRKAAKEAIKP